MSLVADALLTYLPHDRKSTPSGWVKFNAVCCHHRGEKADIKKRGGVIQHEEGITYHCFNCHYKASWQPGRQLSQNMRKLFEWIGVPDDQIHKVIFEIMRLNEGVEAREHVLFKPDFDTVELPEAAQLITDYTESNRYLERMTAYIKSRNFTLDDYPFYWSSNIKYRNRLIVPFYLQGRTVGWTARSVDPKETVRYISSQQPGYVFNLDRQTYNRTFCIVVEGPLDAIHLDATALCGSSINDQQAYLLNRLQKQIIVLPDNDRAGRKLVEQAIEQGWSVSFPEWGDDVNDVGDAVQKYGRLYTLYSIVASTETSAFKIQLKAKRWFKKKD